MGDTAMTTLHERLLGLYGDTASLGLTANVPQGVVATIDIPFDTARDHR